MDKKFRAKIINALRRLSFTYPPRNEAKKLAKVAPAIFACQSCGVHCYDGKSEKAFEKHKETYPDLQFGIDMDHKVPVVDKKKGMGTWDDFIEGLFCDVDNFWAICKACHKEKTAREAGERATARKEKR